MMRSTTDRVANDWIMLRKKNYSSDASDDDGFSFQSLCVHVSTFLIWSVDQKNLRSFSKTLLILLKRSR